MNSYKKGKIYEEYIEHVYSLLLDLEASSHDEPIIISKNVTFTKNGYSAEFDIYYEFTKAGTKHKVAIECKNKKQFVQVSDLRNFHDKIKDFNLTGVFVTNSNFQSGAKTYAEDKGILALRTDELPHFYQLIGLRLKQIYLPSQHVKGEPFYILMDYENGELTGSYNIVQFSNNPKSIMLFLSKNHANHYLECTKETNLVVRGLKQEAFDILILMAKREMAKFHIICLPYEPNSINYLGFHIEPEQLKEEYYFE